MAKALWRRVGLWLPWAGVVGLLALLSAAIHPAALLVDLRHATLWLLLPVIGCAVLGLVLRGIRWHLLLYAIAAPNTLLDSIILFTAAQAALLLPVGQFLLPVLQRSEHGTLIRRSIPTVLVQQLVFGLLVLPAALPSVPPYHPAGWLLLVAFIVNTGAGLFLLDSRLVCWLLHQAERLPRVGGHAREMVEFQRSFVLVAGSKVAVWGTVFDMGAIAVAGLGFYLCLRAVGAAHFTWVDGTAVYALGTSAGALSALPGGLGANEDVSTLVLGHMGLATSAAVAATLLFRCVNLLLGTAIGWGVLLLARRRLKIHPSMHGLAKAVQGAEEQMVHGPSASPPPEHYLKE